MGILAFSALRSRRRIAKFYYYGVEYVPWVPGYSYYDGTCSKESTYLRLYAPGNGAEATFVTDEPIDFTRIDYIELEAENVGGTWDTRGNESHLVLSTDKMGNVSVYNYRWTVFLGPASKQIKVYDTRTITGSYYMRLHAYVSSKAENPSDFRIYAVLESKG